MNRRRTENGNDRDLTSGAAASPNCNIEAAPAPWTRKAGEIVITCRLTPRGGREAIEGVAAVADGSRVLLARVREPPENGRANRALCALLASTLRVPSSRVMIIAGAKGRSKRVAVRGDPEVLLERLSTLSPAR
jgi:uncharacterized protein YggU (UPF0235/DUF167 family)